MIMPNGGPAGGALYVIGHVEPDPVPRATGSRCTTPPSSRSWTAGQIWTAGPNVAGRRTG